MLKVVSFGLQLSKWALHHFATAENMTGCSFHSPMHFAVSHARRKVDAHTDDHFTSILPRNALHSTLLSSGIMFMSQPKGKL